MRSGSFFARVFCLVILTIILTVVCTSAVFSRVAQSIFTRIKENELFSQANVISSVYADNAGAIDEIVAEICYYADSDTTAGLCAVVVDERGLIAASAGALSDEFRGLLSRAARSSMGRGSMRTSDILGSTIADIVGVSIPIKDDAERTIGAVAMMVPLNNALGALNNLTWAMGTSLLVVLPLIVVAAYFIIGRIVMPIKQIRDVAVGMVSGNLEARADDSLKGEMGQLSRSLNLLSQELSNSISALTSERNRLKQTLDGLNEGIVSVDGMMHITNRNPALNEMFSAYTGEYRNDEYMSIVPNGQVWTRLKAAMDRGIDDTLVFPLGESAIRAAISPIRNGEGEIVGAVGMFTDITESERLERTRRDYVANVSHEMRTPLTAMRALLEPLSEGMVPDEAAKQRYYSIMLRETMRLSRLIDDLMELSRLQSGKLTMSVAAVSVCEMARELEGKYKPIAEDHMLTFINEVPDDCPMVATNADRLEQIFVILIDNAMKYTPGEGTVGISAKWDGYSVTVCVHDSGIGIDPRDQPYVFDRFYKVDKAHSELGSGLGLSIAREILAMMGEKIWVESTPGNGSKFMFTLKRA
ncbi:MAG: ATP-binding protein [Clostridia bacterium]|nr:ATP-binding protein [Clostridia bacterium]